MLHTPQQNDIAKQKNHHILEIVHAHLLGACFPSHHSTNEVIAAPSLMK